jgi:hypothetical protein
MMQMFTRTVAVAVTALVAGLSAPTHAEDTNTGIQWSGFDLNVQSNSGTMVDVVSYKAPERGIDVGFDVASVASYGKKADDTGLSDAQTAMARAIAQYNDMLNYDGRGVGLIHVAGLADARSDMADVLAQYNGTILYDGRGVGLDYAAGVSPDLNAISATTYGKNVDFAGLSGKQTAMAEVLATYSATPLYDGRGVGLQMAGLDAGMFVSVAE